MGSKLDGVTGFTLLEHPVVNLPQDEGLRGREDSVEPFPLAQRCVESTQLVRVLVGPALDHECTLRWTLSIGSVCLCGR